MTTTPRLEYLTPPTGFIIGLGRLGENLALETEERTWVDLTPLVGEMRIRRGRIAQGLSGHDVGTLDVSIVDRNSVLDLPTFIQSVPGAMFRVLPAAGAATPLVTATLRDVTFTEAGPDTIATLSATDAMTELSNTTYYGAFSGNATPYQPGIESWFDRMNRYARRTPIPFGPIPQLQTFNSPGVTLDQWTAWGTAPAGTTISYTNSTYTGPWTYGEETPTRKITLTPNTTATLTPNTFGTQTTVRGLTPGLEYQVYLLVWRDPANPVTLTAFIDDEPAKDINPNGPTFIWEGVSNEIALVPLALKPTTSTSTISLRITSSHTTTNPTAVAEITIGLLNVDHGRRNAWMYALSDTVYESSVANHLTVACDSVGAYWYIAKNNSVQFSLGESPDTWTNYNFTDTPSGTDYALEALTYSLSDVINTLEATNHSWDPATEQADDTVHTATDVQSFVQFGRRPKSIDLNLHPDPDVIEARLKEILELRKTLTRRPTIIRFRATQYPAIAANLELTQVVTVTRKSHTYTCRVVGIDHDITPTYWSTALTLEPLWR